MRADIRSARAALFRLRLKCKAEIAWRAPPPVTGGKSLVYLRATEQPDRAGWSVPTKQADERRHVDVGDNFPDRPTDRPTDGTLQPYTACGTLAARNHKTATVHCPHCMGGTLLVFIQRNFCDANDAGKARNVRSGCS